MLISAESELQVLKNVLDTELRSSSFSELFPPGNTMVENEFL